jgi:cation diffusion facilitator family transporter
MKADDSTVEEVEIVQFCSNVGRHDNDDDVEEYAGDKDHCGMMMSTMVETDADTEAVTIYSASGSDDEGNYIQVGPFQVPSLRHLALSLSLYFNIAITIAKLVTYIHTFSLSVLAAFLDSLLDVVSQLVLNYTEKHSSMQRSSALYPAGAARLEPIGVLTCAALMGMASFEVLKASAVQLIYRNNNFDEVPSMMSFWSMMTIVVIKLGLLWICNRGAHKKTVVNYADRQLSSASRAVVLELNDPTMEALAQDHFNDALSNIVAAIALLFALLSPSLWFIDPVGAIIISLYIIYSWYQTGMEQIQHLTGKAAPDEFIDEITEMASAFGDRVEIDTVRAYHFGPKFLVELEVVMPKDTSLYESHDVGMEIQYEIESREEVERCFVHIDCKYHAWKQ